VLVVTSQSLKESKGDKMTYAEWLKTRGKAPLTRAVEVYNAGVEEGLRRRLRDTPYPKGYTIEDKNGNHLGAGLYRGTYPKIWTNPGNAKLALRRRRGDTTEGMKVHESVLVPLKTYKVEEFMIKKNFKEEDQKTEKSSGIDLISLS